MSQIVITFIIPSYYRPQGRVMFSEACVSHSVRGGMISFPVWSHVLLGGGIVSHPVWYHVPSGGVCSQGIFSKGGYICSLGVGTLPLVLTSSGSHCSSR